MAQPCRSSRAGLSDDGGGAAPVHSICGKGTKHRHSADHGGICGRDTYRDEPRPEAEILLSGADFQKADCTGYETGSYSDRNGESRENVLVWNSAEGSFSYTLNVPETGLYCVQASYCPIVSNTAEISVSLAIDGEVPYDTASRLKLNKVYQNQSEIKTDDSGNQVRNIPTASMLRCPRKIHPPALSASKAKTPC